MIDLRPIRSVDEFIHGTVRYALGFPSLDRRQHEAVRLLDHLEGFVRIGERRLCRGDDPQAEAVEALVDEFREDLAKVETEVERLVAELNELRALGAKLSAARRRLRMEPIEC